MLRENILKNLKIELVTFSTTFRWYTHINKYVSHTQCSIQIDSTELYSLRAQNFIIFSHLRINIDLFHYLKIKNFSGAEFLSGIQVFPLIVWWSCSNLSMLLMALASHNLVHDSIDRITTVCVELWCSFICKEITRILFSRDSNPFQNNAQKTWSRSIVNFEIYLINQNSKFNLYYAQLLHAILEMLI